MSALGPQLGSGDTAGAWWRLDVVTKEDKEDKPHRKGFCHTSDLQRLWLLDYKDFLGCSGSDPVGVSAALDRLPPREQASLLKA